MTVAVLVVLVIIGAGAWMITHPHEAPDYLTNGTVCARFEPAQRGGICKWCGRPGDDHPTMKHRCKK